MPGLADSKRKWRNIESAAKPVNPGKPARTPVDPVQIGMKESHSHSVSIKSVQYIINNGSKYMKTLLTILFTLPFSITTHAAESARVMLIGTFHFSNPGKDAVKVDDVDIFDEASQHYLQQFAKRLAEFKPTRGLLEFDPAEEELINQRYSD